MEIALLILAVINIICTFMVDGWLLRINALCGWLIAIVVAIGLLTGSLADMSGIEVIK